MHTIHTTGKKAFLFNPIPVLFIILIFASCGKKKLFTSVSSEHSGIHFNNQIIETDSINVLDFENIYNGAGVGIGDFNNDGLQDIYFAGNMVTNKLYLNKGDFKFEDVTEKAGVNGKDRWCRGVAVVDINNDGRQDIYVCASIKKNAAERENLLYINQGVDNNSNLVFKEMAAEYGLNDTTHSTMASFFDCDNDGDLDVYIVVNQIIRKDFPNQFRPRMLKGEHPSTGRLYRNDWSTSLKHPVFTNISLQAGITIEGYGHSASVTDINKDGWKDILVANDYISQNILYINNRDGTFSDKITSYFKHTSANAMGTDVADINNDGLQDVIELDMNPEDNFRKKMMMNANSYQTYQNSKYFNIQFQYVRNTVQLNQGPRVNSKDSIGDPVFSDIAYFSGLAETDWSWAPLVVDLDDDGFRDIVVTNGFPKDVTDHDFITFRNSAFSIASKKQLMDQIPAVKIPNYAFHNNGDLTFQNITDQWGLSTPSFSNGAAYADLDNDGDMDLIVNNIKDEAFIYKNNSSAKNMESSHFLSVELRGDALNRDGFGTWVELYYEGKLQVHEANPYRGYLSTIQKEPHFGLGNVSWVDSLIIKWGNGKKQVLKKVKANQVLKVDIANADIPYSWSQSAVAANPLFTDITDSLDLDYIHDQNDFIDFNIQKLLPHKFTEYGPALAAGDINGDGLDDIITGGNSLQNTIGLLQQPSGMFIKKPLPIAGNTSAQPAMEMGIGLFDADGDADLDILVAGGGYGASGNSKVYQDKLLINDGHGNFIIDTTALPPNFASKSCVRVSDFDHDGDLDLFIAGRVNPWKYPEPVSSFLYRNDSKNGVAKFTDVTNTIAASLTRIGMVCDAVWTDFDNDGWADLILAGEWMPVKLLKNNKGVFNDISSASGINTQVGWWSSIVPGDFDNDGDMDYIVGNLGLNSFYKANDKYPVKIYANYFDKNDSYDAIPTIFLPASQTGSIKKEFPVHTRDDMTKQLISFRSKYQNYKSYASVSFDKMFTNEEMKNALVLQANNFSNSYLVNLGGGKFQISSLPSAAQYSCINGMVAEDLDADGNLDILISGNDYGTEVSVGRYDACNGILMKGNGKWGFNSQSILQSGWFVPGNGKALVKFRNPLGKMLIAASQNKGPLKVFQLQANIKTIELRPQDISAKIFYTNGKTRVTNVDYGSSFLSQSGRFLNVDQNILKIEITDYKGSTRELLLQ